MRLRRNIEAVTFLLSLQASTAMALDATSATRMSIGAVQNLLVSPPLPTLDAGGEYSVSPSVGIGSVSVKGSQLVEITGIPSPPPPYTSDYEGKTTGTTAGLGLTSPTYGRFGFFFLLVSSRLEGKIDLNRDNSKDLAFENIKTDSLAAVGGVSYRFIGDKTSKFAAGAFLGPGILNTSSFFNTVFYSSTGPPSETTFKLDVQGSYTGLQMRWRLGKFLINPYFLQFQEISKKCEMRTTSLNLVPVECKIASAIYEREVDPKTSFFGYGIFLGYGGFRLNAYSKANLGSDLNNFEFSNYALSYTFTTGGR